MLLGSSDAIMRIPYPFTRIRVMLRNRLPISIHCTSCIQPIKE